jgi:DnaK suppressor protein
MLGLVWPGAARQGFFIMDDCDRGQEFSELFRRQALRAHYRRRTDNPGRAAHQLLSEAEAGLAPGRGAGPGGGAYLFDGVCEDCGGEIGAARRAANPAAVRCIGCQIRHERGARR